jgi:hypothetical protein
MAEKKECLELLAKVVSDFRNNSVLRIVRLTKIDLLYYTYPVTDWLPRVKSLMHNT